ncbi:unnamed protein product [Rotaria sp. Silwood2]|nr:unnamed protein product [Rotaria sp. Silwood2]
MYRNIFTLIYYKLICIFFIISPIINTIYSSHSRSALCFLTRQPSSETVEFALELAQNISSIDVFIIVDNNTVITLPILSSTVQFLQFNETICTKYGFQQANVFGSGKICSAWDKALYYFSRHSNHHSFVWFVEEDVFIPSIQAFLSLHELYSSSYDLVTADIEYNINGNLTSWYHWYLAPGTFVLPWAHGMVCAIGCSRRLLLAVNEYVQWRGHLIFIEFLFHTLSIQDNNMKVVTPLELDTIIYRNKYTFEQIQARPNNWWHPIKNFDQQREWRKWLINNSSIDKKSIFIILNSIKTQLNNNDFTKSIDDIKNQMLSLLAQFEVLKGQIKSSTRRQFREQFLRLTTNRSDNLTAIAVLLADHAYKLPQSHADKVSITNKTVVHVKLEKAIENNKQMILRFMKSDNHTPDEMLIIHQLRYETKRLICKLTVEIRCEQKVIIGDQKRQYKLDPCAKELVDVASYLTDEQNSIVTRYVYDIVCLIAVQ